MWDNIKAVFAGGLGLVFIMSWAFSWILGIYTAVETNDETGWTLFDIIVSLFVPLYGTIIWLFRIVFGS